MVARREGSCVQFRDAFGMSLLRQALDETTASPLLELEGVKVATDWSADGKYIAYTSPWPDLKELSIWAVPTRGSEKNRGHSQIPPAERVA